MSGQGEMSSLRQQYADDEFDEEQVHACGCGEERERRRERGVEISGAAQHLSHHSQRGHTLRGRR